MEVLKGFSSSTNFNVNRVIQKLEELKSMVISYVNAQKKVTVRRSSSYEFNKALEIMFGKES
jgi:hypothetical protein